jgi:Flp pilus assembly protein TadG
MVVSVFLGLVRVFPVKKINTTLQSEVSSQRVSARSGRRRSGAAVLEMAISLPLLITLVFGAMEMANAVFLRQSMNMAAYEAAKVITRPGTNEALARTRCQEIMTVRKVSTYTLTFSPTVTTATPRGTQVTVTLSAPASNLSYGPMQFMTGRTLTTTVVMVRL